MPGVCEAYDAARRLSLGQHALYFEVFEILAEKRVQTLAPASGVIEKEIVVLRIGRIESVTAALNRPAIASTYRPAPRDCSERSTGNKIFLNGSIASPA
jgi:hypothetical protein